MSNEKFLVVNLRGRVVAYSYKMHIRDGVVCGTFPASDDTIVFFPHSIIAITTLETRSFAVAQAIVEFLDDEADDLAFFEQMRLNKLAQGA